MDTEVGSKISSIIAIQGFLAKWLLFFSLFIFAFSDISTAQVQRFPQPEFYTDYEMPETTDPATRSPGMEVVDLSVLIAVLGIAVWFVFKKRSRKWILWLSFFSVLYFGFYRNGCICSIGAIQNIALGLFDSAYSVPYTVIAFFVIPLLLALFAGRIFCGAACPLGIIQDIVVLKPIKINPGLRVALGLIPFIYLGIAVLYAATNTDFLICKYDPFVGVFRMGASFFMILLGIIFLVSGIFIARPFCRFFCPYGALLKVCSTYSKSHLSITPKDCINCNLCKDACPFEAIDYPSENPEKRTNKKYFRRFLTYVLLIPVMFFAAAYTVSLSHGILASAHPDVKLANKLIANPDIIFSRDDVYIEAFAESERTLDELVRDAGVIREKFRVGLWWVGGFIGLVIAVSLLNQVIFRHKTIYEANKGNCYSCGRCMEYCPVGKPDHPYFIENPEMKHKA